MDSKITLGQAAQLMSAKCDMSAKSCENFLKSLFRNIANGLDADEVVKIKDFGTFKVTIVAARRSVDVSTGEGNEIPSHRKVVFVASKELAAAVNAPFEMFDTTEISDEILDQDILQAEAEGDTLMADQLQGERIIEEEKAEEAQKEVEEKAAAELAPILDAPVETPDTSENMIEESETDSEETSEDETSEDISNELSEESVVDSNEEVHETSDSDESSEFYATSESPEEEIESTSDIKVAPRPRNGFGHGFILGLVAGIFALLIAGGILFWMFKDKYVAVDSSANQVASVQNKNSADMMGEAIDESEGVADVSSGELATVENTSADAKVDDEQVAPTQPSDQKPVYDTIGQTRYLGTMAKDHYGNYHLWPYIYEENKKILGHPDRIRPGTRIVIPDLSKYGVDPKNPADIEKAKKKGNEIYARYR